MNTKYKRGDRIRYINKYSRATKDFNKTGMVVHVEPKYDNVYIYLPESAHISYYSPINGQKVSWQVRSSSVELVVEIGEQLEFEFMY